MEIPEGWVRCKIGEVTQIVSGGTPPSKDLTNFTTEGGIPWITPADLSGYKDIYISRGGRNLSDKGFSACSATKIPAGSVLFSSRAPVGYVAIAANELTTNQGFKSFVLPEGIDSRFVYFYLKHIKPVAEAMATGTTFKELSSSVAAQLPLALAPLKEQKLIADKLDRLLVRVDACRDRLERVSCILKDFRQAVIADATSGKLTENWRTEHRNVDCNREIEDELTDFCFADARCFGDFRFPVSWNVARLGEIAEIVGGITKDSKKQYPAYEELPYLRVANVQRGFFDLSEIKNIRVPQRRIEELLLSRGDILFNEGGDIDKLGRGWVWDGEIERCTFQNHVFRVRLKNELFEPKFFSWYGNLRGAAYFLSVGKQTTNLASINKSLLSALPIVIPPAEEQSEIVRRIEVLFAYADRIEARYQNALTRVEQLTPTLLSKAFRGELRRLKISKNPNPRRLSLGDKLKNYQEPLKTISASERDRILQAFNDQNKIALLLSCQHDCETIQDLPQIIHKPVRDLFIYAFEILKEEDLEIRDQHYKAIYDAVSDHICPFCGYEPFDAPGARREALDHYLSKEKYAFAAANLRNLVPMGNKCNSRYKLAQDILRKDDGTRRKSFDPYNHGTLTVSLDNSQPFVGELGKTGERLPKWEIDFGSNTEEVATWDDVFHIRERYERDVLNEGFTSYLREFGNYCKYCDSVPTSTEELIDAIRKYRSYQESNGFKDKAFLKAAVFRMLHRHCQNGDERLIQFIKDVVGVSV
ncbi:restriction endonuclease subunit S [Coleofasciculus sp. G3-WIS-01]|uniref:restriction endonuclease subunit S n=1 Tax=Coleofasciculus sp. G3-WIS-01 TaxID=3069528 RepID=UPI00406368CD